MNLIPNAAGSTPNYYCTWHTQNYGREDADREPDIAVFEGDQGAKKARHFLNDDVVFGPGGMIRQFDRIRGDLYFVFDDGWDVPYGVHPDKQRYLFGSLLVDDVRFPSCAGTPAERLRKLNERVKSFGWRGAGLWIAAQALGEGKDGYFTNDVELERYWRERARWSKEAGIDYWKVDWGARSRSAKFREMLTRVAAEEAPGLIVEHGRGCGPLNDSWTPWDPAEESGEGRFHAWGNGRVLAEALEMMAFSDVLRSYDITMHLSTATTLDRVASLLERAEIRGGAAGLVNCEDELYLGAALGCTVGIMRSSLFKSIPGLNFDPRDTARATDEAVRAVRWQRIAPAFGAAQGAARLSDRVLTDTWRFRQGETWATWLIGQEVKQACPAVVARNMDLPIVRADGEPPYVAASRHPNGAVAAAVLPRTTTARGIFAPEARVELKVGTAASPVGLFGPFAAVELLYDEPIAGRRVWAQDLAGDEAEDITDRIEVDGGRLTIPGSVLRDVGLRAASPGDVSEPGLVVCVR